MQIGLRVDIVEFLDVVDVLEAQVPPVRSMCVDAVQNGILNAAK